MTASDDAGKRLFRSSRNLAVSTTASRILGFFRELLTAHVLGGGAMMSGWVLALTFANMFRRILGEGELGKALVPYVANSLETEGLERARRRFSTILFWLIALLAALTVLISVPCILILPHVGLERWRVACALTPVVMPYSILICAVGAMTSYANTFREYFLPSLTAILQNLTLCAALWLVCRRLDGIAQFQAFAVAVLVAGLVELAFMLVLLWRRNLLPKLSWKIVRDFPTISAIWKLVLPGLLAASALQVSLICDRAVAGLIGDYAASSIYFSDRLIFVPIGIFAVSFATVANTELSRYASAGAYADLTALLSRTIRILLFLSIPIGAFMMLFSTDVIRLFYYHGRFSDVALRETAYAFAFYAAGIPFFSVYKISSVAFTSRRDMITPFKVSLLCIAVNVVLNFALMIPLRQGGIALATIVSSFLNNALLLTLYNRRVPQAPIDFRALGLYLLRLLPACLLPLLPAWRVFRLVAPHGLHVFLPLLAAGLTYGAGLVLLAALFRLEEIRFVWNRFFRRGRS